MPKKAHDDFKKENLEISTEFWRTEFKIARMRNQENGNQKVIPSLFLMRK